jgi:hypothetical protein
MLRFVNSTSDLTAKQVFNLKIHNKAKGIFLHYKGTNKAGQALALSDFGNVIVNLANGTEPRVYAKLTHIQTLNQFLYGKPTASSSTGSSFEFCFYIPFSFNPYEPNAIPISPSDNIQIDGLPSSVVDSGNLSIMLDTANNPILYIPKIITRTETLTSQKPVDIFERNIFAILLKETTTPPTQLLLLRENEVILDISYNACENYANLMEQIEASALDYSFLRLEERFVNSFGRNYSLVATGGSGVLEYTVLAFDGVATKTEGNTVKVYPMDIQAPPRSTEFRLEPVNYQAPQIEGNVILPSTEIAD